MNSTPRLDRRHRSRTFTLIELIVVIVVLGILAAVAVVGYNRIIGNSKEAAMTARNASVAREVAGLLAFQDGTTPEEALELALDDLPAAASVLPMQVVVNGYTATTADTDDDVTFSHASDASEHFVFTTRLDDDTLIYCWVDAGGNLSTGCGEVQVLAALGVSTTDILLGDNDGDGDVDVQVDGPAADLGFSVGAVSSTTTPPATTVPAVDTVIFSDVTTWSNNDPFPTCNGGMFGCYVEDVAVGSDGSVVVVRSGSLYRFSAAGSLLGSTSPEFQVSAIAIDRDTDTVWLSSNGTPSQFYSIPLLSVTNNNQPTLEGSALPNAYGVGDMAVAPDGAVWFVTRSGGGINYQSRLERFAPGEPGAIYTCQGSLCTDDGLWNFSGHVYSVAFGWNVDPNYVFVGTRTGVYAADPAEGLPMTQVWTSAPWSASAYVGSMAFEPNGELLFLPSRSEGYDANVASTVSRVNVITDVFEQVAGSATGGSADGLGAAAQFETPQNIALSPSGGTAYVTEFSYDRLRVID